MSTRAANLGVRGVVVDGCCRDLDEQRIMKFPVRVRCY
jgi:regulator of RNase E activity RraA